MTAGWREYKGLPRATTMYWPPAVVGLSAGDTQRYGSFRLVGSFGESGYYTLPDEWRALKYDPASVSGDGYYLGAVEYRPLWWMIGVTTRFHCFFGHCLVYLPMLAWHSMTLINWPAPLMGMGQNSMSTVVSWGHHQFSRWVCIRTQWWCSNRQYRRFLCLVG